MSGYTSKRLCVVTGMFFLASFIASGSVEGYVKHERESYHGNAPILAYMILSDSFVSVTTLPSGSTIIE